MSEEKKDNEKRNKEFQVSSDELLKKVKEIIHQGNINRVIIKDNKGEVFLQIPATVGILGLVFAPILIAVGALAVLVAKFTIEVVNIEEKK